MQNKYLIILFLNFISNLLLSQQYKATIKQYTEKDGLSSNEVLSTVKDARGVIWIGTKYGLNRFDGKFFKVFTTQNGLFSNYIDQMFVDKERIWLFYTPQLGSNKNIKNIDIFNIYTQKVTSFADYFAHSLPFALNEVEKCEVVENIIIFELINKRVFIYTPDKGFENIAINKGESLKYISLTGNFWFTKQQGDTLYILKRNELGTQIGNAIALPNRGLTTLTRVLFETPQGLACLAICEECGSQKKESAYRVIVSNELTIKHKFTKQNFNDLHINISYIKNLNIMFAAENETLLGFDLGGREIFRWQDRAQQLNSMATQSLVDKNIIWQCSHLGLYRIELKYNTFNYHFPNQQFRNITRINEKMYFCSEKHVIETDNALKPNYLIPWFGLSAIKANDGSLWVANFNHLYKYLPNTKQLTKHMIPCHEPWGLYEDYEGTIWFGHHSLMGYNPATKIAKEVNYNGFGELKRTLVYHFFPINETEILLSTTSGLYKMNVATKMIVARYSSESPSPFWLPANDFRHLYFDKKENIFWLATGQNGLICWNPNANTFKVFPFHNSIANVVHGIYADDFGFLWLSTEGGIIQFHKETHQFKIYTTKDGLPTNEFNRISHFQDSDGTLYFGSVNGVISFHPKNFQSLFYKKEKAMPFVVEVSQYLGKTNRLEQVTAEFEQQKTIYLRPDDRFFTLTMGLKEYEQADKAVYFYQFKNNQSGDWVEAPNNQITLGRLPYGNQILLVKVLLANGQFAETIAEIPIFVQRPFYVTWWFVVLVVCGIGLAVHARIREVQKRNLVLEQEVQQRTKIIQQQASKLQQLDELKSRFFANISHELRTPITLILNPLNYLLNTHTWEKDKEKQLFLAQKNSQKLLRLVNEILDLTKLEAATLTIEVTEIELLGFIQRIVAEFESLAARKNIAIHVENTLQEKSKIAIDVKKVETILYNFITNALKFTPQNGHINIKILIQNADLQIEVSDTGRGIHVEDLPYIFDRFYQSKTNGTSEGGTGLGLALSRELAQLLRGSVWAVSEGGKGSSFFLKLPNVVLAKTGLINTAISNIQSIEYEEIILEDAEKNEDRQVATSKQKILLVEDNFDLQDYIASMLSHQYEIVVKDNGKEAFAYLENLTLTEVLPHLIISDVMMPIMDGYQLLSLLKENIKYQKIPVIMLTARAGLEDKLKALRIGVDDYLTKPFIEMELLTRIDNLLKNANLRKQAQQEVIEAENEDESADEIPEDTQALPSQWLKDIEAMIYENMAKPDFSLEAMSEKLGISRQKLNRDIKKEVGLTAVQYLQEIKLQYARTMLENGEIQNIKGIAEKIGISDVKYFSRLFKARFGRLPSEYLT
jgi:signal transduction histidine kinase/CheY-like chemotaxis protein